MTSALSLASEGFDVFLVEREQELGGNARSIAKTVEGDDVQKRLKELADKVTSHPRVKAFLGARVKSVQGFVGNFETTIELPGKPDTTVKHGVVVVATGAQYRTPTEYCYGQSDRIVSQKELEEALAGIKGQRDKGIKGPALDPLIPRSLDPSSLRSVVMIQCVGSREAERPYCSRICCTEAVKNALKLKSINPKANVYVLYRDMRTYGFKEKLYRDAREAGVMFVRFDAETKPEVASGDGRLHVSVFDPVLQRRLGINADMLVLSAGVVPSKSNHAIGQLLKVPLNEDGFFLEAHMKLRPVDFTTRGVFMAGMAHSPRRIPETVSQAYAAAARACSIIARKELMTEAVVAEVNPRWCQGCGMCEEICQYEAARLNPETGKSEVTAVLCQGCGACAAACPSEAIKLKGFEAKNVISMVDAAL
jgi:heterodisulfide reductase subunit A